MTTHRELIEQARKASGDSKLIKIIDSLADALETVSPEKPKTAFYFADQGESGNTFVLVRDRANPKGINVIRLAVETTINSELQTMLKVKLLKVAEEMAEEFNKRLQV